MRSVRPPESAPIGPGERLVRRTAAGLAIFTLAMIATLLAAVGLVTAAAALETLDQSVDQSLHAAAANMLISLQPTPTPSAPQTITPTPEEPTATPTAEDGGHGGGNGEGDSEDRTPAPTTAPASSPAPTPTPTPSPTPTPTPTPTATPTPLGSDGEVDTEDHSLGSSDTFFLVLDSQGGVVANPQRVALTDLPSLDALTSAAASGEDLRTVSASGVRVRLLTQPIGDSEGSSGYLQSGFVLSLHDNQAQQILRTILIASLIGLLGAGLVTLIVTRRALSPIRRAFTAERRFVAAASHELRTPVAVVRASAEILQREELIKPDGTRLVEDIISESDRLGRLVGDLLALASSEAGQISVNLTVLDMRGLAAEVGERLDGMARDRGVRLIVVQEAIAEPGERELLVAADHERMVQLLTIFIDNAIDHSPPDGTLQVIVRPSGDPQRQRVTVDVVDEGPGVPAADRKRIFEPFAKVAGRRRTTGTTGLGLAIASILADRQDATLEVLDAPGGGACFSVSLVRQPPRT